MERGDKGQGAATGGEHLPGEQGADGVGNGVVDVKDIQRVELSDLCHTSGEGEIVGRVLEEGISRDGDFVKVDVGFATGESEGLRRGDEVDVVPAGGELDTELRSDDAGASVGGVTGDANSAERHRKNVHIFDYKTFS